MGFALFSTQLAITTKDALQVLVLLFINFIQELFLNSTSRSSHFPNTRNSQFHGRHPIQHIGPDPEILIPDPSISRDYDWEIPLDQENKYFTMDESDESLVPMFRTQTSGIDRLRRHDKVKRSLELLWTQIDLTDKRRWFEMISG
uniref:Uncharacterized protein n=1 Tax=Davidia involucrata TaxID=16924 RepID=A0A5B7BRS1_DAVIN